MIRNIALSITLSLAYVTTAAAQPASPEKQCYCYVEGDPVTLTGIVQPPPPLNRRYFGPWVYPTLILDAPICFRGMSTTVFVTRLAIGPPDQAKRARPTFHRRSTVKGKLSQGIVTSWHPQEPVFIWAEEVQPRR